MREEEDNHEALTVVNRRQSKKQVVKEKNDENVSKHIEYKQVRKTNIAWIQKKVKRNS